MNKNLNRARSYFNFNKISLTIRILTLSDVFIWSGWGLLLPLFSVFIIQKIEGSTLEIIGFSATIFLLTKSFAQIPVGFIIDKINGEKDDFWIMFVGLLLMGFIPISYIYISTPMHLYISQFFYGFACALAFPGWYSIFTRHIDKHKEGIEWGVYNTLTDLGKGMSAAIGGLVVASFGYNYVFFFASIISIIGALMVLVIYKDLQLNSLLEIKKVSNK